MAQPQLHFHLVSRMTGAQQQITDEGGPCQCLCDLAPCCASGMRINGDLPSEPPYARQLIYCALDVQASQVQVHTV